jgi:RimJ/RimL family protein N-acetyltransferase
VKQHALEVLRLPRLLAVTNPDNVRSIRIVERLGFASDRLIAWSGAGLEVRLFSLEA